MHKVKSLFSMDNSSLGQRQYTVMRTTIILLVNNSMACTEDYGETSYNPFSSVDSVCLGLSDLNGQHLNLASFFQITGTVHIVNEIISLITLILEHPYR